MQERTIPPGNNLPNSLQLAGHWFMKPVGSTDK
jgi:hypothetical protein